MRFLVIVYTACTSYYRAIASLSLPCFPDFRGNGGYTTLPPGGQPSSTVLYPGPTSSSPRPPTPPFSCPSRCNRAISYVVFLFPLSWWTYAILGVVDPLSFVLHVLPTSSDSSPIFPSNTSVCYKSFKKSDFSCLVKFALHYGMLHLLNIGPRWSTHFAM